MGVTKCSKQVSMKSADTMDLLTFEKSQEEPLLGLEIRGMGSMWPGSRVGMRVREAVPLGTGRGGHCESAK